MEFVKVIFVDADGNPLGRDVLINDQSNGRTNIKLEVGTGHQEFKLRGCGFTPLSQIKNVKHTSSENPMIVTFDQTAGGGTV